MALTDSLISYWSLNEASGNALDAHGSNHLTETGGAIASASGKVGTCRDFELSQSRRFTISDNADLSSGDIDFTIAFWVKFESLLSVMDIVSKSTTVGNQREYRTRWNTTNRLQLIVSADGIASVILSADNFGAVSTGVWCYVVVWHDSVADTINIQVNNGTPNSASHTTGVRNGTAPFEIGSTQSGSYFDGLIDEVGFWKRVLTADERTQLYNSGNGLGYPFTGSINVTSPAQYRTYQRSASVATVTVSGEYVSSTATSVEYQVDGGAWSVLDNSLSGGVYSGSFSLASGSHTIVVRLNDAISVTATITHIRVGDVFCWFGQSNQSGRFTSGQPYTGAVGSSVYDEAGSWSNLASNYKDPNETLFSCLPLLASLIEAEAGVPCGFICNADGGTGLCPPDAHWSDGGAQFEAAMTLVASSGINDCAAILYYQGERDAVNGISAATFSAALSEMLNDMAALSNSPLIAANIGEIDTASSDNVNAIQQGIMLAVEGDADIHLGPLSYDQDFSDGVHWKSTPQAVTLAGRWFLAIEQLLYSGTNGRGPRFVSATRSGTTVTVTVDRTLTTDASLDTAPWVVTDNGTPITVSAVACSGTTITLTLASAPTGTVLVTFAKGETGSGQDVPDSASITLPDASTITLPMEPVVDQTVTALQSGRVFASSIFAGGIVA